MTSKQCTATAQNALTIKPSKEIVACCMQKYNQYPATDQNCANRHNHWTDNNSV